MADVRQMLADPDTFATTLFLILTDTYGYEPLGQLSEEEKRAGKIEGSPWTPDTIWYQFKDDLGVELPRVNLDKIMAAIAIVTSDEFYQDLRRFIWLCNVLADDEFDPTVFDPADAFEMAWGITEAVLLWPPDNDEPFNEEIRGYIGEALVREGIIDPPDVLRLGIPPEGLPDPLSVVSDDPAMYAAFYENKQSKSQAIQEMLEMQMRELVAQLGSLELSNGSTRDIFSRAQSMLS